jgi:hypothetical protein
MDCCVCHISEVRSAWEADNFVIFAWLIFYWHIWSFYVRIWHRWTIWFAKNIPQKCFCFIKDTNYIYKMSVFRLAFLIRCPASRSLNHRSWSSRHGLNWRWHLTLRCSNFPKHLTQGDKEHICFSDGGQIRFPAWLFWLQSTYSWWGTCKLFMVCSQWVQHWPATVAILKQHKNCEWRSGLVQTGLLQQDKALFQMALLHGLRCAYIEGHVAIVAA